MRRPVALALLATGFASACETGPAGPVTEAGDLASGDLTLAGGEFQDPFPVRMEEGQWIKVDLTSTDFDPYLVLRTPDGQQSQNDDAGGDRHRSEIVYRAVQAGQYQIWVTSYEAGETGAYALTYEISDDEPARDAPRSDRGAGDASPPAPVTL